MQRIVLTLSTALLAARRRGAGQGASSGWTRRRGLPAGAKLAVVSGDPSKAGPFTIRVKMPADYAVPPHHHPADEMVRRVSDRHASPTAWATSSTKGTRQPIAKGYHVTMAPG